MKITIISQVNSIMSQLVALLFQAREDERNCCLVTKSCLTPCNALDKGLPWSSVRGISQARILEWIAISYFKRSSQPRDQTHVSCIGRWILYHRATWDTHIRSKYLLYSNSRRSKTTSYVGLTSPHISL